MAKLNEKEWIGIFKAGDYGYKGKYTADDVQEMADHYDPQYRKAPVTIGHPGGGLFGSEEQPAHGWISEVKAAAGVLYARFEELSDDIMEGIKTGKYKGRSIGFMSGKYSDTGTMELWHVAFLGGSTPHATGLLPTFSEHPENIIELEYNENEEVTAEDQETKLASKKELETNSDKGVQDMDKLEELEGKIAQLSTKVNELSARPDISEDELTALKAKADKAQNLEASNETLTTELAGLHESDVKREVDTLFSALRKIGQLTPALEHTGLMDAMIKLKHLEGDESGRVTLNGKDESLYGVFSSVFEALPQIVPMGEVAPKGDGGNDPPAGEASIDRLDCEVAEESDKIDTLAQKLMKADPSLSYSNAVVNAHAQISGGV